MNLQLVLFVRVLVNATIVPLLLSQLPSSTLFYLTMKTMVLMLMISTTTMPLLEAMVAMIIIAWVVTQYSIVLFFDHRFAVTHYVTIMNMLVIVMMTMLTCGMKIT